MSSLLNEDVPCQAAIADLPRRSRKHYDSCDGSSVSGADEE